MWLCRVCGEYKDVTSGGVCVECMQQNTRNRIRKEKTRKIAVISVLAILGIIGIIFFISSGAPQGVSEVVTETTRQIEKKAEELEKAIVSDEPLDVRAETAMIKYLNKKRAELGLSSIIYDGGLADLAHRNSQWIADNNILDHGPYGQTLCARQGNVQLSTWQLVWEDIGSAPILYRTTPEHAGERFIDGWLGSNKGHGEYLLNGVRVGFGIVPSISSLYGTAVGCDG